MLFMILSLFFSCFLTFSRHVRINYDEDSLNSLHYSRYRYFLLPYAFFL